MSSHNRIKKDIIEFENVYSDILNTPYGSFYQTVSIFLPKYRKDKYAFVRMFKKLYVPYLDDPNFLRKTIECFGFNESELRELPIMKVNSKWNELYCPFMLDKDGNPLILPYRRDGRYPTTLVPEHIESMEVIDWDEVFGKASDDEKETEND